PLTEGLEVASAWVAIDSILENGSQGGEPRGPAVQKAVETCGAHGSGWQLVAVVQAEEVTTGKCTIFPVAVEGEVMEVEQVEEGERNGGKKPAGEDMDM
ncbi:hypothetical protein DBR06_SOUSAS5710056, partial [Sousa chinensis]